METEKSAPAPDHSSYYGETDFPESQEQRPVKSSNNSGCTCAITGCLIAIVLLVIILGASFYFGQRYLKSQLLQYTEESGREIARVDFSPGEIDTVTSRLDAFLRGIEEGKSEERLVLNSRELNALLAQYPETQGRVYVELQGSVAKGEVSVRIGELFPFDLLGEAQQRYFNGTVELSMHYEANTISFEIHTAEAGGKSIPEYMIAQVRNHEVDIDAIDDADLRRFLRKFSKISISDGMLEVVGARQ